MVKSVSRRSYKTKVCQHTSSSVVESIALSQQFRIFAFFLSLCVCLSVSCNATIVVKVLTKYQKLLFYQSTLKVILKNYNENVDTNLQFCPNFSGNFWKMSTCKVGKKTTRKYSQKPKYCPGNLQENPRTYKIELKQCKRLSLTKLKSK